jgi:hypothetical protein
MIMKKGDKVKHRNVFIEGKVLQIDKASKGEEPIVHVECAGGTYYDSQDNWEPVKK